MDPVKSIPYSNRDLRIVPDPDGTIVIGYDISEETVNSLTADGLQSETRNTSEGAIGVLGRFPPNSRQFTPGPLSRNDAAVSNGNQRIAQDIIEDSSFYTLITGNVVRPSTTTPQAGSDGEGNPQEVTSSPNRGGDIFNGQLQSPINTLQGIRYPLDLSSKQDYIKFQAVRIKPKSLSGGTNNTTPAESVRGVVGIDPNQQGPTNDAVKEAETQQRSEALSSINSADSQRFGESLGAANIYVPVPGQPIIHLGIQAPLLSSMSTEWGESNINALNMAIAAASYDAATAGDFNATKAAVESFFNKTINTMGDNQISIQQLLAGYAGGLSPQEIFQRVSRKILNPNLELLFSRPTLRTFSFQFNLSAREVEESRQIKQIIKFFRSNMVPRTDETSGLFIKSPYVFYIQYVNGYSGDIHPSINVISNSPTEKACALLNCDVDYTPMGTYMTFNEPDSAMFKYTLTLQFKEIQPIYSKDYDDLDHPIGY